MLSCEVASWRRGACRVAGQTRSTPFDVTLVIVIQSVALAVITPLRLHLTVSRPLEMMEK